MSFYLTLSTRGNVPCILDPVGSVTLQYSQVLSPTSKPPDVFATGALRFDLTMGFGETIVPGSVGFTLGGRRYFDRLGSLYYGLDIATGAATAGGTLNYQTGEVLITNWVAGQANSLDLDSLLTTSGDQLVSTATFRVPSSPLRPGSLQILVTKADGGLINVTAGLDGLMAATGISGGVDYETGVVSLAFGQMVAAAGVTSEVWYDAANVVSGQIWRPGLVFADTLKYNAVAYSYLPLDADLLGIDPVRLPSDGRVPIFRAGGFAVVGHTGTITATVSNAQTINCARERLSRVRVLGLNGSVISTGYTANLEAGTVTFTDVAGYSQPVTIEHRIEDMAVVREAQISGEVAFTRAITHDYPLGSYLSSALVAGDLKARVSVLFDQGTWNGTTWLDSVSGSAATGTFNDVLAPIVVTNKGAITERWALKFTSTSAFDLVGEHVGVLASGTINGETPPGGGSPVFEYTNPATGAAYFTIPAAGFGLGWSTGNILRFNTVGAMTPVWVVRTVQQGPNTDTQHSFTLLSRGDVDRP